MTAFDKHEFWKNAGVTFFLLFLCNMFVITSSFFLFFHWIELNAEQLRIAAPVTFGNVLFLTLLLWIVLTVRSYWTVTRPVRKLQVGLDAIAHGDLSVQIEPSHVNLSLDAVTDSVNRMTRELQSVETLKTDFIANVSHEIKTPIAVMQNYSRVLQSEALPDADRQEYAKALSEAAMRLSVLITNILKLNRLENRQIALLPKPFDLSRQLTEVLLGFESVWEAKTIVFEPEIKDGVTVNSDAELLSIVWSNLLSNAFKFTEAGGSVTVTLTETDTDAIVAVKDTGCGISPETGRRIFEKFYQGDTSHATQGNGLGLALVKRIIDITGGSIAVESTEGKGSTFTVTLPKTPHDEKTA